jgi:hypothetical protein
MKNDAAITTSSASYHKCMDRVREWEREREREIIPLYTKRM